MEYYTKYEHAEFDGKDYKYMGHINGYEIFVNAAWPDLTEQKVVAFLEEKDSAWMQEHIGHESSKHFRRADASVDNHFYQMNHPKKSDNRTGQLLVDRN